MFSGSNKLVRSKLVNTINSFRLDKQISADLQFEGNFLFIEYKIHDPRVGAFVASFVEMR